MPGDAVAIALRPPEPWLLQARISQLDVRGACEHVSSEGLTGAHRSFWSQEFTLSNLYSPGSCLRSRDVAARHSAATPQAATGDSDGSHAPGIAQASLNSKSRRRRHSQLPVICWHRTSATTPLCEIKHVNPCKTTKTKRHLCLTCVVSSFSWTYCGTRAADAQVSPMPVAKALSHHPFRSFPDFFVLDRREISTLEKPWMEISQGRQGNRRPLGQLVTVLSFFRSQSSL